MPNNPSIAVVTCYKHPDYVRAVSLREGVCRTELFNDIFVVKNTKKGVLRYLEVLLKVLKLRLTKNPDVYLLTFRGYETLPFVRLLTLGKRLVYDEFINPVEWFVYEHKKFSASSLAGRVLRLVYRLLGRSVAGVLTDTESHADYSAQLLGLPRSRYAAVPVGTDEATFRPLEPIAHDGFRVLYYGSMLPLHGVEQVIEAARLLKDKKDITIQIVGGKDDVAQKVVAAQQAGANITYQKWVPFADLPQLFASSDLCLGGPFGGTVQSQFVITGKTYQFLAMKRPVVVGENKESHIFTDKKDCLLVPQADPAALRDVVLWAASHPEKLTEIAAAGHALFHEQFTYQRIARDLRAFFELQGISDMKRRRANKQ